MKRDERHGFAKNPRRRKTKENSPRQDFKLFRSLIQESIFVMRDTSSTSSHIDIRAVDDFFFSDYTDTKAVLADRFKGTYRATFKSLIFYAIKKKKIKKSLRTLFACRVKYFRLYFISFIVANK